jgi:hypothetical protein
MEQLRRISFGPQVHDVHPRDVLRKTHVARERLGSGGGSDFIVGALAVTRSFRLVIIMILLVLASPVTVSAQQKSEPIFGIDKVKHFFIAGFVETMTFAALEAAGAKRSPARTAAIGTTAVVSFGREIHDRRTKGLFSVKDLLWDALGAGAALLVINKVR